MADAGQCFSSETVGPYGIQIFKGFELRCREPFA